MELNPDLNFVIPREGSNIWVDTMVIPRGSRNKAEAEAFINFMSRPDIALLNTLYVGYSTVNAGAFSQLPDDWRYCEVYWPLGEDMTNMQVMLHLGDFTIEYDRAWTEILAAR
jgi:spermidine/putrescine transport system substrate-binding protein